MLGGRDSASPRRGLSASDLAIYAGTVLAWSFSWIMIRWQVGVVEPEVSVVWRFALSAPIMLAWAKLRGERLRFPLSDHLWFFALGATLFSLNFTLFYHGAKYLVSGLLPVVFSLASVVNVLLAAALFATPINPRVLLGALLGACGVGLMFYPEIAGKDFGSGAMIALALCAGGTLSFCFGNMVAARLQRRALPVFAATGWGMAYGALLLAILAAARGHAFIIEPSFRYLASLAYLAVAASVIAFACYLTLLGRIGADRAAYATVLMPIGALLVSTALENYRWTWPALIGIGAVLAGNVLVLRTKR